MHNKELKTGADNQTSENGNKILVFQSSKNDFKYLNGVKHNHEGQISSGDVRAAIDGHIIGITETFNKFNPNEIRRNFYDRYSVLVANRRDKK